jgi:3-methyladenine DNA glycosylase AlkC
MAEPLKNSIDDQYLTRLTRALQAAYPKLSTNFKKNLKAKDWDNLALKQRLTRMSESLRSHLPDDYPKALKVILKVAPEFGGFEALFFPEFVSSYGRSPDHRKLSLAALLELTQYSSSELAVRPFIEDRPATMMKWMLKNSRHKNYHIRRLASEGCRPRLPWASQLIFLREDPSAILPILDQLRADPELYVRKSVANNLNDITKDHPEIAIDLIWQWKKKSPQNETQWIIRHGLRSLIKQGHPEALKILGYAEPDTVKVSDFSLDKKTLAMGQDLLITTKLRNSTNQSINVVVDYVLHHKKSNGKTSPKVFKGSNIILGPRQSLTIEKRHKIRPITTRRYYPGQHWVQLQINGQPGKRRCFDLICP